MVVENQQQVAWLQACNLTTLCFSSCYPNLSSPLKRASLKCPYQLTPNDLHIRTYSTNLDAKPSAFNNPRKLGIRPVVCCSAVYIYYAQPNIATYTHLDACSQAA